MLRRWRLSAGQREGRRRALPQAAVAERAGVSERWYRKFEHGEVVRLERVTLERLANALLLDESARAALFLQAMRLLPVPGQESSDGDEVTYQGLRLLVGYLDIPAVLTNGVWDVLAVNPAMEERFPGMWEPGMNLAAWLVREPDARNVFGSAWGDQVARLKSALHFAREHHPTGPMAALGQQLEDLEGEEVGGVMAFDVPRGPFQLTLQTDMGPAQVFAHVLRPLADTSARLAMITPLVSRST